MEQYIMALDQGTTSCRCILYDKKGEIKSIAQKEFQQIYPQPGWVEHDPMEIWSVQVGVAQEAMYKINLSHQNIAAIGITNQRETTVLWDKNTGNPIYNAIVWQCRRTADICKDLKGRGLEEMVQKKTGLIIDAYFSATKIKWILDRVPGAREKAEDGQLCFGTMETWLMWRLTGGKVHATDYSNASRTMLYHIGDLTWDEEILRELEIPPSLLPEVLPSSHIYGMTEPTIFGGAIPIAGAAGDQQAALFGQTCFTSGEAKNTYGTGCFLLMNTGEQPVFSQHGLLTTIAWGLDQKVYYALEGSVFVAGAAIQWLRDELHMIENSAQSEKMAMEVPNTNGVYVVPAFVGLGAPHWDSYARGMILGLSRGAGKNHVVRATLESLAYQTYDLIKAMEEDCKIPMKILKVDGGASANNFLMQFQSDITNIPLERPTSVETTSLGAAYLAGLAVGFWKNKDEVIQNCGGNGCFQPKMEEAVRTELLKGWERAIKCALLWAENFS